MAGLRKETTKQAAARIEEAIIAKLKAYAIRNRISNPIIRDLLPNEDLKGAAEVESGHIWQQDISALQYHTVYSGKNDKDRAFAIFGVKNAKAEPLTTAIRFYDGTGRTALLDEWQVEHAWLNEEREAYADAKDAIFYGIEKGYNIDFLAGASSGMDGVILIGKVVEPSGKVLTPSRPV